MNNRWLMLGAVLALGAVIAGAFGDHLMRPRLEEWFPENAPRRMQNWETAGRYWMYHALAICIVGLLPPSVSRRWVQISGLFFLLGIILFSGCLIGLAVSTHRWLAHLVPFGGLSFMIGWVALIIAAAQRDST